MLDLNQPMIASVVGGLVAVLLTLIYQKLIRKNTNQDNSIYPKVFALNALVVFGILNFQQQGNSNTNIGKKVSSTQSGGGSLSSSGASIHTGHPQF